MMQRLRFFSFFAVLATALHGSPRPVAAQAAAPPVRSVARPAGEERALLVYPNPSTGIVHVAINGFEGRKIELSVLNVIGTVMYRETLSELNDRYTRTLDLSKFANGLYYVKMESDNTSEMRKLVIR
ncbi:T9SS type A sorting domain-containing protein [Hymenobacter sp. 102]|uniref:T9SS type A sorting domain-containing protein n=1 Tax=Hymenobacter sp. 102 TaxID=3403152 RepID=UPI003CE8B0F6